MKKIITVFLAMLLIMQSFCISAFASAKYPVVQRSLHTLGGSTTARIITVNNQIMIALDSLSFYLGADTGTKSGAPFIGKNGHTVVIPSGSTSATVDNNTVQMPAASFTQDNVMYVPLDFVVKSIGYMWYYRSQNQTIYIQSQDNYQKAQNILDKSLAAVKAQNNVTTSYKNYTNLSDSGPERYFVQSIGTMQTSLKQNIAHTDSIDTVYNGYYDSIEKKPSQTYVSKAPVESWKTFDYVTAKGIYTLNNKGKYVKEPVPPENISTMDMASKSAQIDKNLFLYSATINDDDNGKLSIKAETDVGLLIKVGFDIYMPKETKSLKWSETYQTVTYDPATYLPMQMSLYLRSNFTNKSLGKVNMEYMHNYNFTFDKAFTIKLPKGVN